MFAVFLIMFIVTAVISIAWASGIDKMPKDYKGDDFLNHDDL